MTTGKDEVALYEASDGAITLDVRLEGETVWLTQKQMAILFGTERSVVTKHLHNIFATKELEERSNVQKMHIAHSDKPVKFYNLDIIISVGYRVNSKRGTQFRIWVTNVLLGYSVNDRRPKEPNQAIRLIAEKHGMSRLHSSRYPAPLTQTCPAERSDGAKH